MLNVHALNAQIMGWIRSPTPEKEVRQEEVRQVLLSVRNGQG